MTFELIERSIQNALAATKLPEGLARAVEFMLFPGGKRLRPRLALAVATACGADVGECVKAAAALELLHVSTLIHDDLPALDNDDFRRGRPSCHRAFGEAEAILAGDVLVGMAFQQCQVMGAQGAQFSENLSRAYVSVCAGQYLDMRSEGRDLPEMAKLKTGALFGASAAFGSIAAALGAKATADLYRWGVELGLCFQMRDDYLDLFGNASERGRPSSSDDRNDKNTFFRGIDRAAATRVFLAQRQEVFDGIRCLPHPRLAADDSSVLAFVREMLPDVEQRQN